MRLGVISPLLFILPPPLLSSLLVMQKTFLLGALPILLRTTPLEVLLCRESGAISHLLLARRETTALMATPCFLGLKQFVPLSLPTLPGEGALIINVHV